MVLYTILGFQQDGGPNSLEAVELENDGAAFVAAGQVLEQHQGCEYAEVWDGERAVVARFREQPVLRPVPENEGRRQLTSVASARGLP